MSRVLALLGTRSLMSLITISIKPGRRSCAALLACAGSTSTGTKLGMASAGSAKRPSLAALIQFDSCCGTRSCRRATSEITASGAIWADMANIVWASGLRVTAAWYVVTETDSALREAEEEIGLDGILAELNCGGKIPRDRVLNALRLLCEEVKPRFH